MVSVTIKVRRAAALGPKRPTGTPGHGGQREGETMEGEEEIGEGSTTTGEGSTQKVWKMYESRISEIARGRNRGETMG